MIYIDIYQYIKMGKQLTSIELPDDLRSLVDDYRKENGGTLKSTIIKGLHLLLKKDESEGNRLTDEEILKNWREAELAGVSPLGLIAQSIKERRLGNER